MRLGQRCKDGAAGMVLQGRRCRDGAAGTVLQGRRCRDGAAGTALRHCSHSSEPLPCMMDVRQVGEAEGPRGGAASRDEVLTPPPRIRTGTPASDVKGANSDSNISTYRK